MATVTLDGLSVSLGKNPILDGISVAVADGAFVAVVGPSGAGKSTLLRAIAGLVPIERGTIRFDGVDVTGDRVADRDIGMVFQTPALLPTRNVRRNVQFPLELRRETAEAIRDRVAAEARSLQIEHLLTRRPQSLSRGEEQLVQIARTMVRTPRVLLLDEPFAPLDEHLRHRMRSEMKILQAGYGVTTLMATNDPTDAATLASKLIVLGRRGDSEVARIVQVGTPGEIHEEPVDLEVATATGPLWTISAKVVADRDGFWLTREGSLRMRAWAPSLAAFAGSNVTLGVRTAGLTRDERGEASATLDRVVPGTADVLVCRWGGRMVNATGEARTDEVGTTIRFRVDRPLVFASDTGERIA